MLKIRVSKICMKRIRINQGVGLINFVSPQKCMNESIDGIISI